jgi:predicted nucleic acid-binding protein
VAVYVSACRNSLADALPLIERRYAGRAFLSTAVYDEILAGVSVGHRQLQAIDGAIGRRAVVVLAPTAEEYETCRTLLSRLGKGEVSCLALARCRRMTVVTDDRAARRACEDLKVRYTGTIGILQAAVRDGHLALAEADAVLDRMIAAGFWSPVNSISQLD